MIVYVAEKNAGEKCLQLGQNPESPPLTIKGVGKPKGIPNTKLAAYLRMANEIRNIRIL